MPRFKNVDGVMIQFTAEEETARDNEETTWSNAAPARALSDLRVQRNILLAETDFYGNSDVTMSDDMKTYRQALRDLPSTQTAVMNDFGGITGVTYPTKPS